MFGNLKVGLIIGGIVLVAGAVSTSALTTVSADRGLALNLMDDSIRVGVKIECINNQSETDYSTLCQTLSNGNVSLDLNKVLGPSAGGYNRGARFTVGSAREGGRIFRLTNNAESPVKLYFEGDGAVTMLAARGDGSSEPLDPEETKHPLVVASGEAREFYFQIQTPDSGDKITGTMKVR